MRPFIRALAAGLILPFAALAEMSAQATPAPETPVGSTAETGPSVQPLEATLENQLIQFDLNLTEPGYVALSTEANGTALSGITIFDGSGLSYERSTARIAEPDGAYVIIDRPAGAAAVDLTVETWPEMDLTEPNDDGLLAWPLEIGKATEVILMAAGDQDVFRFTLDEETHLTLLSENEDQGLSLQYLEPETERQTAYGQDVTLPAGDHLLRLSFANRNHFDPEPFQVALVERKVATPLEEAAQPKSLSIGSPTHVVASSGGLVPMTLEIEKAAYYLFRASNVGPYAAFAITNEEGDVWRGADVHLSPGTYTVDLSGVQPTRYPSMVSVYQKDLLDPLEPNDLKADATRLEIDKPVELIIEQGVPSEWITFTPQRDGKAFIMAEVLNFKAGACSDLLAQFIAQEEPLKVETIVGTGPIAARTYGPIEVISGEPFHAQLVCPGMVATEDTTYRVRVDMPDMNRSNRDTSVYLVGLELNDSLRGAMQMSSDISGVQFLEAEEAETLDQRIEEIARAETSSGPSLWLILLIAALLGGAAFWFWWQGRGKSDKAEPEPDPGS